MERAEVLMLKLQEQYRKKETAAQMLLTIQLLQQELMQMNDPQPQQGKERSKVSVVLPFRRPQLPEEQQPVSEEKIIEVLHIDEEEVERELEQMKQAAGMKNEISMKIRPLFQEPYDPMEDVPTLASHIPAPVHFQPPPPPPPPSSPPPPSPPSPPVAREPYQAPPLHHAPFQPASAAPAAETVSKELNEKLKETTREVAHKLQDSPIKDLRKAIGINDRYLYINELFNGDEAMFERSVKTLNQFSILPEAEFWMQRELRIKLAWKEDNTLVHQFVQLVRRRFS
jgi:hypothetical protein